MTSTDFHETLVGGVLRIADTNDLFLVETCRADSSGKVLLRLSGMSGVSIDKIVDAKTVAGVALERVTKETFFSCREVCPLCSHPATESRRLFSVRQLFWNIEVRECDHCGMAYKDPIANKKLLDCVYTPEYTHFVQTEPDEVAVSMCRSRLDRLGKVLGRHLDYGCGAGHFVEAAQQAGWDSFGADPFLPTVPSSSPLAGRLLKMDASDPLMASVLGKFDCISMWAVVEHLTSFKDTLSGLLRLLNPGGKIVFNSPNAHSLVARHHGDTWRMATLIEHVEFCTPSAIKWLAANWDLKVQRLRICGSPFPMGRGGGPADQGLGSLPFPVPLLDEGHAAVTTAKTTTARRNAGIMNSVYRRLIGTTGGHSFGAAMVRQFIHTGRLGDHIEVTCAVK
jgi:SAM-dependent methyltransferase